MSVTNILSQFGQTLSGLFGLDIFVYFVGSVAFCGVFGLCFKVVIGLKS